MKKLLLSVAAFAALVAAPVAMADPNDNQTDQTKQERPAHANRDQNGAPNAMQGPAAQDRDNAGRPGDASRPTDVTRARPADNDNRVVNKTVVHKTVTRTEVMKVRANIQAPKRFHFAVAYRQPVGFYVHRWTFGERLPVAFYVRDYWIADFALYGLIAPWPGYEWVRVGDDALLVDVETGEVIRVEYGLFY
jgi:Ni/Co efflux regulator RcnB